MRVVTGEAKGRKLKGPKTPGTRPIIDRVKTALFDILSTRVEDTRFLDLFAGVGSVGIEALSRGAASATFMPMEWPLEARRLSHGPGLFRGFAGYFRKRYRPELHYMRGPGPKWHERHAARLR